MISGAIRGAVRSGRYANRSIATPSSPQPTHRGEQDVGSSTATGTDGESGAPKAL